MSESLGYERVVETDSELGVDVKRKSIIERLSINTSNPFKITWLYSLYNRHIMTKKCKNRNEMK
jgi:hypothetical protein